MSKLVSVIYKTFENLIKLNNINITIIYDKNNKIWFSLRELFKSLEYKDIKKEIKRINIDKKYISTYGSIYNELQNTSHIKDKKHSQMVMIDEAGIYIVLDKSNKPIASQFRDELFTNVLPELRNKGEYKFNSNDKKKLKTLKDKLNNIHKEQSLHNKTKKIYNNETGYGFIYVLETKILKDGNEKKCYKIGYTKDLNKRLNTYKTGHPDINLVYSENVNCNKKQLEKCVLNLNSLKRLSSKNEIICNNSLDEIKREITDCKKLITKHSHV
jgi:prophage antirepressor-like protein